VSARVELGGSGAGSRGQPLGQSGRGEELGAALSVIPRAPGGVAREAAERDASIVRKRLLRLATAVERGDLVSACRGLGCARPCCGFRVEDLTRLLDPVLCTLYSQPCIPRPLLPAWQGEVQELFSVLKASASATGTALQRVLHYYLHALMLRLTGLGPAFLQKESQAKPQVSRSRPASQGTPRLQAGSRRRLVLVQEMVSVLRRKRAD